MTDVRLQNLTKKFGETVAVNAINLTIDSGELVVLVGPSGCGKTTSLRMIAGLEEVTSGQIIIGERDVARVHAKDRNVAMVFQSYALYPHMSVAQNLGFALKLRKMPRDEIDRRVQEVAATLGIAEVLPRKPKTLSGGQQQRVALGRAIMRDPSVFLFDEPLSNLDAKLRTAMRAELIKLHHRLAATMIYVTHDQVEAMTMGDRIVVMNEGEIQQSGTPLEVYDDPDNAFVAGFIGSPAMNQFDGRVTSVNGALSVAVDGFALSLPASHPAGRERLGEAWHPARVSRGRSARRLGHHRGPHRGGRASGSRDHREPLHVGTRSHRENQAQRCSSPRDDHQYRRRPVARPGLRQRKRRPPARLSLRQAGLASRASVRE